LINHKSRIKASMCIHHICLAAVANSSCCTVRSQINTLTNLRSKCG
jgi:hypothetical protein